MQQRQGLWPVFLRLFRNTLLVDVGIFVIVGLLCWLLGWRTWWHYGRTLVIGGALCTAIGMMSMMGGTRGSADPNMQYLESIGQSSPYETTKLRVLDAYSRFRLTIVTGLAGLIAVLVGTASMRAVLESLV